jgi:segregation and condensation protein B
MTASPIHPEKPEKIAHGETFDLAAALGAMQGEPSDDGLSLDDLSRSYSAMLGADDPYLEAEPPSEWNTSESLGGAAELLDTAKSIGLSNDAKESEAPVETSDEQCAISPRSIWESILFVGQPGNQPIRARDVAKLMRGVTSAELDELVQELNLTYQSEGAPYRIVSVEDGYRMELAPDVRGFVEARMAGKAKEARLSQSQVETLAIVAYHQPITAQGVGERRGRPSGAVLSQLVRRGLLVVESGESRGKDRYRTSTRFLQIFHLKGLSDLPQVQDLDRSL